MVLSGAAAVCALSAWSSAGPGVRVTEAHCAGSQAFVVEASEGARFVVATPGPSMTTPQFAASAGALVAANGGLFDARERPMGPSRGGGRDWPRSPRTATAGVFGANGARAEIAPGLAPWMTDAVSGWPMLVEDGVACAGKCGCPPAEPLCNGALPRTAVGVGHGRVLLVVATSLTLRGLASFLAQLGAQKALNLDGGGSASLVVGGRVLLGGALAVPTHLGILAPVKKSSTR
jgi:hypothetical protein